MKELTGGRFQKVLYNSYVARDAIVTPEVRARAALHVAPAGAVISHESAAELWGLPVSLDGTTHLSVNDKSERLRRVGVTSHLRQVTSGDTVVNKIPLTTPEQTFIDLAASGTSTVDLVVIGDAMLKAGLATIGSIREALDAWIGAGTRIAYRALKLIREGVDSVMETKVRLLIVFAGLPEPQVNMIVRAEDGSWRMRFDLSYPEFGIIVEYDGRQHAESSEQWERDIYRREELDRMGFRLIVITSRGVYRDPEETLHRVKNALQARGAKVRRQLRNDWRRHFPAA